MQLAIASGKGGTGKTTVATNLATVASQNGQTVAYLDCDVEEPNGHIFLKPTLDRRRPVTELVPDVDVARCTLCGQCAVICQYNAIACLGGQVLIYPELCHSCGGCQLVCPTGAIQEIPREMGLLETGHAGAIRFAHGLLNVGEVRAIPVIQAVQSAIEQVDTRIIDAPPGTSCPVIEAVRGCDLVVLVTEPTPFGFHDLKLAVEMTRAVRVPTAVVINRAGLDGVDIHGYCTARRIPVLAEIPDDRRLAQAYSRGDIACQVLPEYQSIFSDLLDAITATATAGSGTTRAAN